MIISLYKSRLLLGFAAVLAWGIVAACGSAEEGLTRAELDAALAAAAAAQPAPAPAPAGPSAAEISELVSAAVAAAAPAGVSSADIAAAVSKAVAASAGEAVTAAEIQALVASAVEGAVAGGPTPLTAAQIAAIVDSAVAAIPTPAPVAMVVAPDVLAEAKPINVPAAKGVVGEITIAISDVFPGVGLGSAQVADEFHYWGMGEVTFQSIEGNQVAPMLATGWTLKDDFSGGTLTIRDDVIFHGEGLDWAGGQSWGPMTAADIAYTINEGNGALNPASIHWQAGDLATMFGANPLEVVDDTTIAFTFNTFADGSPIFDLRWNAALLNDAAQAFSVQSLALNEAKGDTWMIDNPLIGTGPYHFIEWTQDDVGIVERVPYDHWSGENAGMKRITYREVSEESTKVALMETGEIDAAEIALKNLPSFIAGGFKTADNGDAGMSSIIFSGNLWETENIITKAPLDTAAVYMRDVPWVGNPRDVDITKVTLASAQASAAAGKVNDFEEAILVRNALARAIDRDAINQAILNGLGFPIHLQVFCPCNSNWESKWEYPFDPALAERMLDQSGNIKRNGKRFEIPLFGPDFSNAINQELGDAIAGFWDEIGVKTTVQKFAYSVYRPTIVARATTLPWVTGGDDGHSLWPWDWPKAQDHTSLTRGGYGIGIEIPFMAEKWLEIAGETDSATRISLNNEVADYMFDQAFDVGVVGVPAPITFNPNSIADWPMDPALFTSINNMEGIVPASR